MSYRSRYTYDASRGSSSRPKPVVGASAAANASTHSRTSLRSPSVKSSLTNSLKSYPDHEQEKLLGPSSSYGITTSKRRSLTRNKKVSPSYFASASRTSSKTSLGPVSTAVNSTTTSKLDDLDIAMKSLSFKAGPIGKNVSTRVKPKPKRTTTRVRSLVGLQNLGNTCYLNSQLQSLACLPDLVRYFSSNAFVNDLNSRSPSKGRLAKAFAAVVKELALGHNGDVCRPTELKRTVSDIASSFIGYAQQDSQEWLRFVVSGLHDDVNRVSTTPTYEQIEESDSDTNRELQERWWNNYCDRNSSFMSELFCGQLFSQVQCLSCQHISRAFDPFWDLSVPIPSSSRNDRNVSSFMKLSKSNLSCSLLDCFDKFMSSELLTGNEQYYCSRCKSHRDVKKKLSISRFPKVLVLHLKRFLFSHRSRQKINTMVEFPLTKLDLSRYQSEHCKLSNSPSSAVYDLVAVSNHFGGMGGGHYTAFGRTSSDEKSWAEFDDSSAKYCSADHVVSSAAYVLFYNRKV